MNSEPTAPPLSLRDILFVVFTKLHVLGGTLVLVVGLVFVHVLTVKPVYEVSSTILVKPIIDSRRTLHAADRLEVAPVSEMDINSEIKILLSDELVRKVIQDLQLAPASQPSAFKRLMIFLGISRQTDPEAAAASELKSRLNVEPITLSNMIRASLRGSDPEAITRILQRFLERYIDRHIEVHKTGGGPQFYAQQAEVYEEKLSESEEALKAFQARYSIVEAASQKEHAIWLLRLLRQGLSELRGRIAEMRQKLTVMRAEVDRAGFASAMPAEFRNSTVITDLIKAMVPLLVEKERIALLYPETTPEYIDAASQLKHFQEQLALEKNRILKGIEYDLNALLSHEQTYLQEIEKIQTELKLLSEKEIEKERLMRSVEQNKQNLNLYLAKAEESRISDQRDRARVANVSIASAPQMPSIPVYPRRVLMMLAAVMVGFVMGLGATFGAYYLDHTIKRPDDLIRKCDLPVLSSLSLLEPPK